jgi:sugar phosphate isomerase/epimerase
MAHPSRRSFLKTTSLLTASTLAAPLVGWAGTPPATRKFTLSLNPGNIGVSATQTELLALAHQHGFTAITAIPHHLASFSDEEMTAFVGEMREKKISWGSANLPVDFRKDDYKFQQDLALLPKFAQAMDRAGAQRMNTWIMPTHPSLSYFPNFRKHAARLREVAVILEQYGIRLGLEYVGSKTLVTRSRYPFLRTLGETRELIGEIGQENVGFVLDSYHWYCAEDTAEDLLSLKNSDIIACDLNDARADLSRDEQIDGTRELPGATGVIDLKTFVSALVQIGYDGPVRAEPFNQVLRDMEDHAAIRATYDAMMKTFELAG